MIEIQILNFPQYLFSKNKEKKISEFLFSNKKYKEIEYLQKLEETIREKKSNQRKRDFFMYSKEKKK